MQIPGVRPIAALSFMALAHRGGVFRPDLATLAVRILGQRQGADQQGGRRRRAAGALLTCYKKGNVKAWGLALARRS